MFFPEVAPQSCPVGADLSTELAEHDTATCLVGRLAVQPVLLLAPELGPAGGQGAAPHPALPSLLRTVHTMHVLLMPAHTVLRLKLLPTNLAGEKVARVCPLVLLVSDQGTELFVTNAAVVAEARLVNLYVLHQVTTRLELLGTL